MSVKVGVGCHEEAVIPFTRATNAYSAVRPRPRCNLRCWKTVACSRLSLGSAAPPAIGTLPPTGATTRPHVDRRRHDQHGEFRDHHHQVRRRGIGQQPYGRQQRLALDRRWFADDHGGLTNSGTITVAAGCNLTVGGSYSQAASATLSMPGGGSVANPATNVATNSDFESPASTTTRPSRTIGRTGAPSYVSTQYAYTGSQSLEMSGANSGVVESFAATPGTSYTVSADAHDAGQRSVDRQRNRPDGIAVLQFVGHAAQFLRRSQFAQRADQLERDGRPVGRQRWRPGMEPLQYERRGAVRHRHGGSRSFSPTTTVGTGGGSVFWDDVEFGPSVSGPSTLAAGSISNSGSHHGRPEQHGHDQRRLSRKLPPEPWTCNSAEHRRTGAFGFVNVTGAATLAGTLKSDLVYGYTPSTTDSFTPMEFASESGTFSNVFASQQFELPVRRRRHVYERRGQRRSDDGGHLHDQRQYQRQCRHDEPAGRQPCLLGRPTWRRPRRSNWSRRRG